MPDGPGFERPVSNDMLTVPNVITFARLCAVPVAVWLVLRQDFAMAFWLFVAAGISDGLDGWLARRSGPTLVGTVLDPVADKALLVSMYVTLAAVRVLPDWLAILVVFRDVVIVGGVLVLGVMGQSVTIRPLLISKLNTFLQLALVAVVLLLSAFDRSWPWLSTTLIWAVAASTLASGGAYLWKGVRGQ